MSDYTYLTLAQMQTEERLAESRRRERHPRPRRTPRRRTMAKGLHRLADRIDI